MNEKQPLKVIAGGPDKPFLIEKIGLEIDCYVLEGEIRVLSQRGLQTGIGMSASGATTSGAHRMAGFLRSIEKKGIEINDLMARITAPIEFQPLGGGRTAYGYEAEILPDLCNVVVEAWRAGVLQKQQEHIAKRCEALLKSLPKFAMDVLVDEFTGYHRIRSERALAEILDKYLTKELSAWAKTFPDEFYQQIYRLKGWQGPVGHKRSPFIGNYTNDIVYDRLAPGVLDELKKINPKTEKGYRKAKHHQYLTRNWGYIKLREHLAGVIAIMRVSPNWDRFMANLKRAYKKVEEQLELDYPETNDEWKH
ncbi:MAG: P63C domain-containing protein [Nitrospinae bacterium]|nr:P63C domain-containing protein [Nitrospinota bacterium]